MKRNIIITIIVATLMAGVGLAYRFLTPPHVPLIKGYAEGQEIQFLHTEVSDKKIADILTGMRNSPVLFVPELALSSETMLAKVYVFKNGLHGLKNKGPLGFQPDVFDNPPGQEGYRPLREVYLAAWKNDGLARLLKSAEEVQAAESMGEITIGRSGVVVNMPLVTWPGGKR